MRELKEGKGLNILTRFFDLWDDAGLGLTDYEKSEIKRLGDHSGLAIYVNNTQKEHDKMFKDHCDELDTMLKCKHLY